MTWQEFKQSIAADRCPKGLGGALEALWYDARGDWERAHQRAQDEPGASGAWVHAYLHRKEGDLGNAAYWYRRAGRPPSDVPLEEEWRSISTTLLDDQGES
jgi:hypothetical protein